MEALQYLLAFIQAVGAIVGAGGAVVGELFYFRAIRDGRIDDAEREHLRIIAQALRVGMMTVLLSSIALVLLAFVYTAPLEPALTVSYWAMMTIALVVILSSWALSKGKLSFALGSGAAFTGWWFIALLTLGQMPAVSYGAVIATYIVATAVISAILGYLRTLHSPRS